MRVRRGAATELLERITDLWAVVAATGLTVGASFLVAIYVGVMAGVAVLTARFVIGS
jgi:hypothetical protein